MAPVIGLLGCGTIGSEIASAVADGTLDVPLEAVYDLERENARAVQDLFDADEPRIVDEVQELASEVDIVVEAAGQRAVEASALPVLEVGADLLIMSVGALADAELRESIVSTAEREDAIVYAPSGAIAGLDAIKAAALTGDLDAVGLTTRKPPAGLAGAPYIEDNDVDLDAIEEETVVFEGAATEAAAAFPSNINVALSLSLAGIGPDETTVTIVADPDEENNVHAIEATGGMGRIETEVRNVPSPTNPKTSYLAAISAIEKLRGLTTTVRVGT
jgi:aspartate dehydrogenase